jgi:hypothetical protein
MFLAAALCAAVVGAGCAMPASEASLVTFPMEDSYPVVNPCTGDHVREGSPVALPRA